MKNLENLLVILSVDQGKLKVLLEKKSDDPYKGYWIVPGKVVLDDSIDNVSKKIFKDVTLLNAEKIFLGGVYSTPERKGDDRVVAIVNVSITSKSLIKLGHFNDLEWFEVNELPKLAYDHKDIISDIVEEVKTRVIYNYSNILFDLFPNNFTLSELQKFYENMVGKSVDRRNFRKKIINQKMVIDTGLKTTKGSGRPGTLYRFSEKNMKGKRL